jgi:hypothetical protein
MFFQMQIGVEPGGAWIRAFNTCRHPVLVRLLKLSSGVPLNGELLDSAAK